jgi:hypothetical protein
MERRQPDFEDEKLRYWAAPKETDNLPTAEGDPTVLGVDLVREEIFESRVYQVRREAMAELAAELIADHPEVPPEQFLTSYFRAGNDSSFRFFAKRDREKKQLTWLLISVFAGERQLLERHDQEPESAFREAVSAFEADALADGVVDPPAVITLEEWRRYDLQRPPQSP